MCSKLNTVNPFLGIKKKTMELSNKDFEVLDALDRQEITTQRQLSRHAGISLGQVNYLLKSLLQGGLVKLGNFRKNPNKIGYVYLLTPKGIEAKSMLAAKFVTSKLEEYHSLRHRLAERLLIIEKKGRFRIVFVGPEIVKEFVASIIKEKDLNLSLTAHCHTWNDLKRYKLETFDIALLFDGVPRETKRIAADSGIPRNKLMSLW